MFMRLLSGWRFSAFSTFRDVLIRRSLRLMMDSLSKLYPQCPLHSGTNVSRISDRMVSPVLCARAVSILSPLRPFYAYG